MMGMRWLQVALERWEQVLEALESLLDPFESQQGAHADVTATVNAIDC